MKTNNVKKDVIGGLKQEVKEKAGILKRFIKRIVIGDEQINYNREDILYWKNKTFYITSAFFITAGAPLMLLGAYVYYITDLAWYSLVEVVLYLLCSFAITNKHIKIDIRKLCLISAVYSISIFLVITTGFFGAGLVCIIFSMILAGCLLDKKQIVYSVILNIIAFVIITILLYQGVFDGTLMGDYKSVWIINALTTQVCGIFILSAMYIIFTGLEKQAQQIKRLSRQDSLTGLYNRAFFELEKKRLDQEKYLPLSIIVGDINGLKIINDSLGHIEGDKLLVKIASIIKACCRSNNDIVARIGGDEFNILLPNTDSNIAQEIINLINHRCREYNENTSGDLFHLSISLGYATRIEMNHSLDAVYKTAEDFMYKRKLLEGRSFHSSIISSMKMALYEKSHETEQHANRLVDLSKAIGKAIGLTGQQFDELELFATLHDIGKIGIDNQILNKPSQLTEEEWLKMKKHSEIGYRIAMTTPELMSVAFYILTHHERWDGKGYPQGLKGDDIPLLSRILAIVDTYDAMTEDRPYRKGLPKEKAIEEIRKNAGTQFDPELSKVFLHIISE